MKMPEVKRPSRGIVSEVHALKRERNDCSDWFILQLMFAKGG
jgi:hypothetical protein